MNEAIEKVSQGGRYMFLRFRMKVMPYDSIRSNIDYDCIFIIGRSHTVIPKKRLKPPLS